MKLKQLQSQFSESLFYQHHDITKQIKETASISQLQRLQVYRNSFIMGVTDALAMTYQHTLSLVGEEFFNTVNREFILKSPPSSNNIMVYGAGFSEYLATLKQLKELPYISEMARFEWLLEQTTNKQVDNQTLDVNQLAQVPEDALGMLRFSIPKQVTLFHSSQNIARLYQMLMNDTVVETDLNTPCYLALKKHQDFRVELIQLSENEFSLLQQINNQQMLAEIMPHALHQQLPHLLEKQLLNGFTVN